MREFFTTSTHNLLVAERDASVRHHVAVSIVGATGFPGGYLLAKVVWRPRSRQAASPERSCARRVFEFLGRIVEEGAEGDTVHLSRLMQPSQRRGRRDCDRACYGCAGRGRVELGGPEELGIDAWTRRLFAATATNVPSYPIRPGAISARDSRATSSTPGEGARISPVSLDAWSLAALGGRARSEQLPAERGQRCTPSRRRASCGARPTAWGCLSSGG